MLKRENSATHGDLVYVRLAGIGCPAVEQPFGKDAKRFAIDFCKTGNVDLVGDGRPADLNVNGKSLRAALLSAGLAWHDGDHNNDSELATLQAEAKAAKRGLWADEDAVPPWEWRE